MIKNQWFPFIFYEIFQCHTKFNIFLKNSRIPGNKEKFLTLKNLWKTVKSCKKIFSVGTLLELTGGLYIVFCHFHFCSLIIHNKRIHRISCNQTSEKFQKKPQKKSFPSANNFFFLPKLKKKCFFYVSQMHRIFLRSCK